jgi:hypothetical protein
MAFTGLALYNTGVFSGTEEDVSDMITMISPSETPLLDALSQPENPASNVLHEWLEESLGPNTVVSSVSHANTSGTAISVAANLANYLQAGMVLKNTVTAEFVQVTAVVGNTLTISRGFGSTVAATINAGDSFYVVSTAELEGADVARDVSLPRSRKNNYVQIFKKDIIVSGTMQAVSQYGVQNEYDKQMGNRMRELIRDLEKASIIGKSSGNTLGSASAYRTFSGIWDQITTNSTSMATISSIGQVEDVIQTAWNQGASDLDLIVCDNIKHRQLSNLQFARTVLANDSTNLQKKIMLLETSYGDHRVLRSRWMPTNSMLVISSGRIHLVPLQNRSFRHSLVGATGDSTKGFIVGEYTVEVHNEAGMAKAFG